MHILVSRISRRTISTSRSLIRIENGTFYREHPSSVAVSSATNPPLFPNLNFDLQASRAEDVGKPVRKDQHWAVIGSTGTSAFFDVLRGKTLCLPPNARAYPYLASDEISKKDPRLRIPSRAIQYVGFASGKGIGSGVVGSYLSARYESRREETDWSVMQYLKGETELNPADDKQLLDIVTDQNLLNGVISDLRLQNLVDMPVSNLSNGQTRRARIAKALLSQPELLLLDEPFMGLDPYTSLQLSPLLQGLAYRSSPLLMLALRPQDPIPEWITHLIVLGSHHTVALQGQKASVLFALSHWSEANQAYLEGRLNDQFPTAEVIELLRKAFGPPLNGVGDALTKDGLVKHDTYKRIDQAASGTYFRDNMIKPELLDEQDQKAWKDAYSKPINQRNASDWLKLIGSMPHELQRQARSAINQVTADSEKDISDTKHLESEAKIASKPQGDPLTELNSIIVKYGSKTVLGHGPPQPGHAEPGLNLIIRQGTRLALLGPNGSGKTTLLSLLTSDHPQSYSLPIKFFGRTRLPEPGKPGLSLWEIQSRIGHSAPEVHGFFPKMLSVRSVLESAWSETYTSKPVLNDERNAMVDLFLRHWEPELRQDSSTSTDWARNRDTHRFGVLPFGIQRLLLLLRAIIKQPDIIILDEAFSGLPNDIRDKAIRWLERGQHNHSKNNDTSTDKIIFEGLTSKQGLLVVSHVREEVPGCVNEWVRLPSEEEALQMNQGVRSGQCEDGWVSTEKGWRTVWRI